MICYDIAMTTAQKVNASAWTLTSIVIALAVYVWGHGFGWRWSSLNSYQLFPVLGLIAFSTMWSHYIASVIRQILGVEKGALHTYFEATSLIVLAAILMHPGLLWYQLWRDGFGLPPGSYLHHYVAPSLRWAAILGTVSLFVFLAYEFRRKFKGRPWWRFVAYASDLAMLAILVHSLKLGTNVQSGWFRMIWYFYGVTLVVSLAYIYYKRFAKSN